MSEALPKCTVCEPQWCMCCWLYVIADRAGDYPVKVGISVQPVHRLSQHRKDRRRDLYIVHKIEFSCEFVAAQAEELALRALDLYRTRGDWFMCSPEIAVRAAIAAAKAITP